MSDQTKPDQAIAIIGGGVGGLTAAIALAREGFAVRVFEQAPGFARVGADINLTPNAVRALDGLGLGDALRAQAARPTHRISRMWDTGEETSRLAMSDEAEAKYGSPQLTLHRADLMQALEQAVPEGAMQFGTRVASVSQDEHGVEITFANGTTERFAAVIGADGIHSAVRKATFGAESPRFTGVVAFRAVVPADRLAGQPDLGAFTKWWGPDAFTQIVTFPLSRGRDIFIFATIGQDSWTEESWTTPGSSDELRALYANFHPEATNLLAACDDVLKTALYERDPMPVWSQGAVVLMGDAAHPMLPFMAQGAGQAIEDGVVLARCAAARRGDLPAAFTHFADLRRERTAKIQLGSRGNEWLKRGGDADWVYGYDVWAVDPLGSATAAA
jgi:salicylate hydroxylase